MLTAAVRDLHRCYPRRFLTDVRTLFPAIWDNNPHLTKLSEDDPDVEQIECAYPLINHCNHTPHHCLHGFIEFLNGRLGLRIQLSGIKGDLHLSALEKSWYSQVEEVAGQEIPFWIVAAGGKYDVTIKWWESSRYQEVIDHFRGKIQFVQVGHEGHHHPKLEGAIDFRGQTNLRELIRLVYHSQGVLCPVTSLMHLAAAVETKRGNPGRRPCVVIAGGREPAHWETYPGHQFIHLNGALPCSANGGCWKDRTLPLRDGAQRDEKANRCVNVAGKLPRCMDMISPEHVIHRIELYYRGGTLKFLSPRQRAAAERGIEQTRKNDYDQQPLNIHGAGLACDSFIETIGSYPGGYSGRGVVICGGGLKYFTNAWVCISMLRRLGCNLPVQLWQIGRREMDDSMKALLEPLAVECVDASRLRKKFPSRILNGWELKAYAILHSRFREVLLLDADNVPIVNPQFLFDTPEFQSTGAIFWPDYVREKNTKARAIWRSCGLTQPDEPEFETGQIVVDKERCWRALRLSMWFNENSDFYYDYVHGDKETFHLAFRKLRKTYALVPHPIHTLPWTMCQHDFQGRRILQHRNGDKWDFLLCNRHIRDFRFERECRQYVAQLQRLWDGRLGQIKAARPHFGVAKGSNGSPNLSAVMISCPEREELRQRTLKNLRQTDWGSLPLHVEVDQDSGNDHERRQTNCALLALKAALDLKADYILFLEDDLEFNRHIRHNLTHWQALRRSAPLASLYNPRLREIACDARSNSRIVPARRVFGSQALVIARPAVKHLVAHWDEARGMQDIRISRLIGRLGQAVFFHAPSLVQHVGSSSASQLGFHQAGDFDPNWKAQPNG